MLAAYTTRLHPLLVFLHFSPCFAFPSISLKALGIALYMGSLSLNYLSAMSWWSFRKIKKRHGGG